LFYENYLKNTLRGFVTKLFLKWLILYKYCRCGHSFTGPIDDIKNGVDGVLGLMPRLFSFPYQLASAQAIHKVIGLCLCKYSNHHLQEEVGYLFFGDEVVLVQEQMIWIEMIDDGATLR